MLFEQNKEKQDLLSPQKLYLQSNESHTLLECTYNFFKLAIPTIISCVFLQLIYLFNMIFAGTLNDSAMLAGVGLGTTLLNVVILEPLLGMNGALETLISQAYGAKQLQLCGVYINRARIINTLIFIP